MEEEPHILVVDDDDRLRGLLTRYLREHGFTVTGAGDAGAARVLLKVFAFDLMVLDVMMPGESGLELAGSLKVKPPVLMLSARSASEDRVAGLEVGVDDYLTKPFEPRELVLRIRAILRRSVKPKSGIRKVVFGDFAFDVERAQLTLLGEKVHLTSAEELLLKALASQPGQPVSRETLAGELGLDPANARGVDVQVTRLRKKIEAGGRPHFIQTVRGEGYRLQGDAA